MPSQAGHCGGNLVEPNRQSIEPSVFYRWAVHRRRLAAKTARDYLVWIRHAEVSLEQIGQSIATASLDDLLIYYDSLKETAWVHNNARAALVVAYDYLGREDNPAKDLPRWKVPARLPKDVELEAAVRLVVRAYDYQPLFGCITLLYLSSGLRCSELVTRKWSDRVDRHRLYYTAKGGMQKVKELNDEAAAALDAWREECPDTDDDWMFPSPRLRNRPIGINWVNRKIKDLGRDVGIPGLHVHRLRHTHAMEILRLSGHNILAVQESLGHARVASTMVYLQARANLSRDANAQLTFR